MSFDEKLAARIRPLLAGEKVEEKKMFGGLCFMVRGSMCCGVLNEDLIVRVVTEEADESAADPHARPFDFTGKPMTGMFYVAPGGVKSAAQLSKWVKRGLAHVAHKEIHGKKKPAKKRAAKPKKAR